jgi:uncharacterized protein
VKVVIPVAGGGQYVSWIHEDDFTSAIRFIIDQDALTGPVNLASPVPVRQRDFMRELRAAWGVPVGLPASRWMAEIGALAIRTDTELLLKSRRVAPARLTAAGFEFQHGIWPEAARDLARISTQRIVPPLEARLATGLPGLMTSWPWELAAPPLGREDRR